MLVKSEDNDDERTSTRSFDIRDNNDQNPEQKISVIKNVLETSSTFNNDVKNQNYNQENDKGEFPANTKNKNIRWELTNENENGREDILQEKIEDEEYNNKIPTEDMHLDIEGADNTYKESLLNNNVLHYDKNCLDNLKASDLEDLSKFFNRENYTKYIHILFKCALELMTNRDFNDGLFLIFSDKYNFSNLLSDFESQNDFISNSYLADKSVKKTIKTLPLKKSEVSALIINPDFINILIQITQKGNFSYIYRLLIEIQLLIHENEKNSEILASNDDFNSWFIEIIFHSFTMFKSQKLNLLNENLSSSEQNDYVYTISNSNNNQNKNEKAEEKENASPDNCFESQVNPRNASATGATSSGGVNDDLLLDNFLSELNSIFIIGKKIHTKIFSDLFFKTTNNPIKRLNFLLNWAFHLKTYRSVDLFIDDNTLNDFIRIFLDDIFDNIKEFLIPSKDSLKEAGSFSNYISNNSNWENFIAYTILVYEYMTFFNASKNSKFFSFDNEEVTCIPEKIILSLNLNSIKKFEEEQLKKKSSRNSLASDLDFVMVNPSVFIEHRPESLDTSSKQPSTNPDFVPNNTTADVLFEIDDSKINKNFNIKETNEEEMNFINSSDKENINASKNSIPNHHYQREDFNIASEWNDYMLFYKIYQFISKIWLDTSLFTEKIQKKTQSEKDECLIIEYILTKSKRDLFLNNIKILFYTNSWSNEFLLNNKQPGFNNNFNSNKNVNNLHPHMFNTYFHSSVSKFNNPPPNYKHPQIMLALHYPIETSSAGKDVIINSSNTSNYNNKDKDNIVSGTFNYQNSGSKELHGLNNNNPLPSENTNLNNANSRDNLSTSISYFSSNSNQMNKANNIYNIYDIPLIKVINNFFVITINLSKDAKVFSYWMSEYEKFLVFLIFASSNLLKDNIEAYNYYQDNIIDLLLYAICYLLTLNEDMNNYNKNKKGESQGQGQTSSNKREFCEKLMFYHNCSVEDKATFSTAIKNTLIRVFSFMTIIHAKISTLLQKKKKKLNIFSNFMTSKKEDLSQCAVYKFFTEILIDYKDQMLFNSFQYETHSKTHFMVIDEFLKKDATFQVLFNAQQILERKEKIFDMKIYKNIIRIRSQLAEKYVCVEQNQLLKPRNSSIKTLIKDLKVEKAKAFCFAEKAADPVLNPYSCQQSLEFNQNELEKKFEKSFSLLNNKLNHYDNISATSFNKAVPLDIKPEKFLISDIFSNYSVFRVIENSIQKFISDIRDLESDEIKESKNKHLLYKYIKKKFFSWRGFWADKELFFKKPELLKYKVLNHYTSDFATPFLTHLLDIEYYLPKFTSFDPKNLLHNNKKNLDYHICLDIGKILNIDSNQIHQNQLNQNSIIQISKPSNKAKEDKITNNKTTFIFDIYKLTSKEIWKAYIQINQLHENYKLNSEDEYFNNITQNFLKRRSTILNPQSENLYDCCYVKKSHHIKGIFQVNNEGITFRLNLNKLKKSQHLAQMCLNNCHAGSNEQGDSLQQNINNNPNLNLISKTSTTLSIEINDDDVHYDEARKTCVGSYITFHKKDKDKLFRNFPYEDIRFIFKRNYYLRKSGLEIFVSNQSYFFNFRSNKDRDMALKEILANIEYKKEIRSDINYKNFVNATNPNNLVNYNHSGFSGNFYNEKDNIIGYENLYRTLPNSQLSQIKKFSKVEYVSNKIELWSVWKISNFEMLMWMNLLSNRSYSDISQYPVFPWILKNYNKNLNADIIKDLRDFKLPMGIMNVDEKGKGRERMINYLEMYKNTKEDYLKEDSPSLPYFYGHTYSNPMYITHYMTR